jgi:hypothetical protein
MKMRMCRCKWSGLIRPEGPIKIKSTATAYSKPEAKTPDVLVAKLGGAVRTEVTVVKHQGKFFFKGPKQLGGLQEVPADSLTDCLNYKVWELGEKIAKQKGIKTGEAPRTRGGH